MSAATHAFVPTTCDTCHETGVNFYPSAAALNLQARPNSGTFNHLTSSNPSQVSGDCSLCHNTTSWATNVLPAGHMPNPANKACSVCHTTPGSTPGTPDYTQYSLGGVHTGSSSVPARMCHSGGSWIGAPVHDHAQALVGSRAGAHPGAGRCRLQWLPCDDRHRHRRLRRHGDERGQARLRRRDLRHLPRGGPELLSRRAR